MTSTESYLNNMTDDLKNNQAFVVSNWGGDASWLWKDRCSGTCNWPALAIQNIKIVTGGAGPTPGPYDPNDFDFGDSCATGHDDDCATQGSFCMNADHCRWSWSKTDPSGASGDTAHCRCDGLSDIDPADYDYGDACASKDNDDCSIMHCPSVDHCRWSWAKDDPEKWSGKTAHCRCDEV